MSNLTSNHGKIPANVQIAADDNYATDPRIGTWIPSWIGRVRPQGAKFGQVVSGLSTNARKETSHIHVRSIDDDDIHRAIGVWSPSRINDTILRYTGRPTTYGMTISYRYR